MSKAWHVSETNDQNKLKPIFWWATVREAISGGGQFPELAIFRTPYNPYNFWTPFFTIDVLIWMMQIKIFWGHLPFSKNILIYFANKIFL